MAYSTPAVIALTAAGGFQLLSALLPAVQPKQVRRLELYIVANTDPNWAGTLRISFDGIGWGTEYRPGDIYIREASDLPREQVHLEQIWLGVSSDGGGFRCSIE